MLSFSEMTLLLADCFKKLRDKEQQSRTVRLDTCLIRGWINVAASQKVDGGSGSQTNSPQHEKHIVKSTSPFSLND
jgi:hypothetical protein